MWSFEHTESTTATPERIWAYYADPASAPSWDHLVAEIQSLVFFILFPSL